MIPKIETIPAADGHAATTVVHVDPQEIEDPNIPGTVEHGIFGHWRLTQKHPFGEGRRSRHGHLPAVVRGGLRQERPVPAARLAAGCDGRPHAGQRLDPRGHDGHGRRLPGRPLHAAFCGRARRPGSGFHDRRLHGLVCRADRPDANRFEADPGLLDRQPARIHVPGPGHGQPARRDRGHVPLVHARLLQGPVVPRRRQRDARHGRSDRHSPVRRAAAEDADDALDLPLRLPGPVGHLPLRRLLEQRRHPGRGGRKGGRGPRVRSTDTFITPARSRPSSRRSTRSGPISSPSTARSGFPRRPAITPTSRRRP